MSRTVRLSPLLALVVFLAAAAHAQAPPDARQILRISGGYGLTLTTEEDTDGSGSGAYLDAEYAYMLTPWFSPRLYAGGLLTFPDEDSCATVPVPCDVQSKIFFLGAKVRLMAPIPYVGPFIELGVGASLGYLRTLDILVDERVRGVAVHVPVTIGLALGKRHEIDLMFSYLFHPSVKQVCGAIALGFGIPLR